MAIGPVKTCCRCWSENGRSASWQPCRRPIIIGVLSAPISKKDDQKCRRPIPRFLAATNYGFYGYGSQSLWCMVSILHHPAGKGWTAMSGGLMLMNREF